MNKAIRIATALLAGLGVVWFVTFVVTWHIRTGWQQHWMDGAIRAWSNFSMLEWFDTAFAAALIAALAAFTLLLNSTLERERKRADDFVKKREALFEATSALQLAVKRLAVFKANNAASSAIEAASTQVDARCAAIAHDAPPLASSVMYAVVGMEQENVGEEALYALAWAATFVLSDPSRYFRDGYFQVDRLYLSAEDRERIVGLSEQDRERYRDWLDFES